MQIIIYLVFVDSLHSDFQYLPGTDYIYMHNT